MILDALLTLYLWQPGNPDGNTWDGFNNMMEISYVAHHVSV